MATDLDASNTDLVAGLADMYAVEVAASTTSQMALADLDDYETGKLETYMPSPLDGNNAASHPGQLKDMLDEFDLTPLEISPTGYRISEFQDNMQDIDRTKENVAGYFYLVEDLAMESADTLVDLARDAGYEDWVTTYLHPLLTDEREDRNEFEGYLEGECGWDEVTPERVQDRLGIEFDSIEDRL